MTDSRPSNPIFALFLGLPGVILWLGGLWICYTGVIIHILYPGDWDFMHTPDQQKRLIIIYCIAPFTPIIGYSMIVLASILCGFDRYRLPPKQTVALACFDALQQILILLALCQIIMMGPWGVYDFMNPTILIISGVLIILFLILRRHAKRNHREWHRSASQSE
ncbi:hypothetical protein [Haloferula sp.]|uniref:hypothetical protein n=1 Tax=Haloferula sp. TaxID=2497595 RepID=UPI00329D5721